MENISSRLRFMSTAEVNLFIYSLSWHIDVKKTCRYVFVAEAATALVHAD